MSDTDKHTRREAKEILADGQAMLQRGDYAQARAILAKVVALAPDSDTATKATVALEALTLDRWAIYGGLGFALLFVLAWVLALG